MKTKINPSEYEELKKIIQEANPEIMELKFGCVTERGTIFGVYESQGYYKYAVYQGGINFDNGEGDFRASSEQRLGEIFGRPITLFDCTKTIKKLLFRNDDREYNGSLLWRLNELWGDDNNLDNQSPECLTFLCDLLL